MNHQIFMYRALEIATHGRGNVAPNPMVGCVIVHDNVIIGEGYHCQYGQAHAEVNAVNSVKNVALLSKSTLYVTLEPCSHFGKTPPCADWIIKHHIPKVVVATLDTNPKVAGKGVEKLRNAGVEVVLGVLENEAKCLNRRFFTYHQKHRPYIILKWAQTLNGFMDCNERAEKNRQSYWITNETLRYEVQRWRTEEDAIFCGANTILNDNPQLNSRLLGTKNPIRLTFLNKDITNRTLHFFDNSQPTLVFNTEKDAEYGQTRYVRLSKQNWGKEMMDYLYEHKIQSVIVEGGQKTLQYFLEKNLWDEMRVLVGNKYFLRGLIAPQINIQPTCIQCFDEDKLLYFYRS